MEDSVSIFCKTLASFCNHLDSSCDALKQSVERRPIPLDSASSTFIECLNRRVKSASSDLNLLESMSFGTVSFEELLGHCNEVYKKNQNDLVVLEDHLKGLGYVPEVNIDEADEVSSLPTPFELCSKLPNAKDGLDPPSSFGRHVSTPSSAMKRLEDIFDESSSLKDLGLSDVCLATLASEANGRVNNPHTSLQEPMEYYEGIQNETKEPYQPLSKTSGMTKGEAGEGMKSIGVSKPVINVSKDDYESLQSYIKNLASWEDLVGAVEKMNKSLSEKGNVMGNNFFHPDQLASLGLGAKGRSYLLLLVRMNKLVVETVDGVIAYRVLQRDA